MITLRKPGRRALAIAIPALLILSLASTPAAFQQAAAATPPAVATGAAANITSSSVTLNGNLTALGTATTVNVSFEYGPTTSYGTTTAAQARTAAGAFTASVTGLNPGTTYHFRARADGGAEGVSFGNDAAFATTVAPPVAPTVTTSPATTVTGSTATLNGNLTALGTATTVNVSFEYGPTTSYGTATAPQARTAAGAFTANITGLTPGATYNFRARADGGDKGTGYGANLTLTTTTPTTPPTVATSPASNITTSSATLNGNLTALGTVATVNVSFEYGPTTTYGTATQPQAMTAAGAFTANITGLTPGTTYHYRAKADGGAAGVSNGNDATFATTSTAPTVTTNPATAITTTGATLNGNLTSLGAATTVNVSFEYGATTTYGAATQPQAKTATGAFTTSITGLTAGTTYHYRAKADGGAAGISNGNDVAFATTSTAPTVTTNPATAITATGATLNGSLTSLGAATTVNMSFEYGETDKYGTATKPEAKTAAGVFTASATELKPGTVYHFRAKADGGDKGVAYGSDATFTTTTGITVTTGAAAGVTTSGAALNGSLTALGTAATVKVSFEYGPTTTYGTATTPQEKTAAGAFTASVTGLAPNTLYHFRAKADGGDKGAAYGNDLTFTTQSTAPAVTTNPATAVSTIDATLNGTLTSLGAATTVNVSFEYGATDKYGSVTKPEAKTATGAFNAVIGELKPDTAYYFRAKADGGDKGVGYGNNLTFTTQRLAPAVNTNPATEVTASAATLNGFLVSLGASAQVSVSFEYGSTDKYGLTTQKVARNAAGAFSLSVSDLKGNTAYHYRARADGGDKGIAYGNDVAFTTLNPAPAVTTSAATNIAINAATLNGSLTALGAAAAVNVSFEYGNSDKYGQTTKPEALKAPGAFSAALGGLEPNTKYHFRAKADGGDKGVSYGPGMTLTTLNTVPIASTVEPGNVTFSSAILNGNLVSLGTAAAVNVSFEYGASDKYGQTTKPEVLKKPDVFSAPVSGLTPKTAYHYRARADGGDKGVAYGNDVVFTTGDPTPKVASVQPGDITHNSATLNGFLQALGAAAAVNVSFEYGASDKYGQTTKAEAKTATGAFEARVTGLTPKTLYHYRPRADGGDKGVSYGDDFVLTTLGPEPVASTGPATEITTAGSSLRGNLTSLGTAATVNVSFEYGATDKYGQTTKPEEKKTAGSFTAALTGLTPNTLYHFRAKADGGDKMVVYGADVTFTTASVAPVVKTEAAGNVSESQAALNGNLASLGQAAAVNVSFEYGETDKYGTATKPEEKKTAGAFTAAVTGLKTGVTYHYRARADGGDKGVAYGADVTFTPVAPGKVGRKVAYVVEKDGSSRIYVADEDGSNARALDGGTDPAWSPDGTKIAYVSDKHPNQQIYIMNADGSGARRLSTNDAWDEIGPAWSPDGAKIAFVSDRDGSGYHIYVMSADGSGAKRLTRNTGGEEGPAWSPDGTKIAFVSDQDGPMQIYIINADGSGQRRLTNLPTPTVSPAWSPDGKKLAFVAKQEDKVWSIYVMNADGSDIKRLVAGFDPAWSADGSRILLRARTDGSDAIYAVNAAGGTPVKLSKENGARAPKVGGK